jgi:hypothetical protein
MEQQYCDTPQDCRDQLHQYPQHFARQIAQKFFEHHKTFGCATKAPATHGASKRDTKRIPAAGAPAKSAGRECLACN